MKNALGLVPPFAWPILISALLFMAAYWLGLDSRLFDGILFGVTLAVCVLVGVVGSRRETLNDKSANKLGQ